MKPLNTARLPLLLLAAALACYGQHGRGGGGGAGAGAGGGHMGGGSAGGMQGEGSQNAGRGNAQASPMRRSPEQALDQNQNLSAKLQTLLPAGTTPQQACGGFKNLGQCVAAIHVSHNLGLPFPDLKSKLTGSGAESLGKAIHGLKPDVNANAEKKKAEKQAKQDLTATGS